VLSTAHAVPLRHVAVVTFTEKAGADLRDRLRVAFESELVAAEPGSDRAIRATGALDDLDAAAIGTLHSFAERILGEHPVEAGLPPLIEVCDEVASGVAFDDRWTVLRTALLDDPGLTPALLLAMATGMRLEDLRSMARAFTDNWDQLQPRILVAPAPGLPAVEVADLITEARRLARLRDHCTDDEDKFLAKLDALAGWAARLETAADDPSRIGFLAEAGALKWVYGHRAEWVGYGLDRLKDECRRVAARAAALRAGVVDAALRQLAGRIAAATLEAAGERRAEGAARVPRPSRACP
jgi:ATP-dependent helicase/nuclease subunit A